MAIGALAIGAIVIGALVGGTVLGHYITSTPETNVYVETGEGDISSGTVGGTDWVTLAIIGIVAMIIIWFLFLRKKK